MDHWGEFADRSYLEHFKHAKRLDYEDLFYAITNFEVEYFTTTQYSSSAQNVLARFKFLVAKAINDKTTLPKAILFVPDDDIIKQSASMKSEGIQGFVVVMQYLLEAIHHMVTAYKTNLPKKAIRDWYPQMIWILPPHHKYFSNNMKREQFSTAIEQILQDQFSHTCALHLKKVWDEHDEGLYYKEQRCYSQKGLHSYWTAIDAAVKFWDRTLSDILLKKQKKSAFKSTNANKLLSSRSEVRTTKPQMSEFPSTQCSQEKTKQHHMGHKNWHGKHRPEMGRSHHYLHNSYHDNRPHNIQDRRRRLPTPP